MSRMNFHDDLTPLQARVLYHVERVFRSAGGNGCIAHRDFTDTVAGKFMRGYLEGREDRAATWDDRTCMLLLGEITAAARRHGMHHFRPVDCGGIAP
jgi:hypothetical protein